MEKSALTRLEAFPREKSSEKFGGNSGKRVRKTMLSPGEHLTNFSEFSLENLYGYRQSSGLVKKFYYDLNKGKKM
jgi:hypothetical protein